MSVACGVVLVVAVMRYNMLVIHRRNESRVRQWANGCVGIGNDWIIHQRN